MATIDTNYIASTATAAGDLTGKQWHFGKLSSTGVTTCSVLGERAHGIIGSEPNALGGALDFYAEVGKRVKVSASGAISKGDEITTDANGQAKTAVSTNIVTAIAEEAATNANDIITVRQVPAYAKP